MPKTVSRKGKGVVADDQPPNEKPKTDEIAKKCVNPEIKEHNPILKSKKELRAEKKAQKRIRTLESEKKELTKEEEKQEHIRLKKEAKKERRKLEKIELIKEQRKDKQEKKRRRLHREMNAPGGAGAASSKKQKKIAKVLSGTKKEKKSTEQSATMNVLDEMFNGTTDDSTGMTTLRMGVKYKDVAEGKGDAAEENTLVTVKYKLTGGRFGAVLDSSKSFSFRVGKREVIQGWDIGVNGMKVGGRRQLVVPPKAGYGSDDIGAGPGAMLFFDITLLSMR